MSADLWQILRSVNSKSRLAAGEAKVELQSQFEMLAYLMNPKGAFQLLTWNGEPHISLTNVREIHRESTSML